jgi:thermitase
LKRLSHFYRFIYFALNSSNQLTQLLHKTIHLYAVGAVDQYDRLASFSNYGTWVDAVAPGVDIASTITHNRYAYMSGTSMASPHVAGLAALLASQGRNNVEIRQAIEQTADKISGSGTYFKYGRINSYSAVTY